jgi:hypothetical protein
MPNNGSNIGEWKEWSRLVFSKLENLEKSSEKLSHELKDVNDSIGERINDITKDFRALEIKAAKLGAVSGIVVAIFIQVIATLLMRVSH